ncbi:hypothetical protein KCU78_g3806, partial [Aureobasidium melanogenum]
MQEPQQPSSSILTTAYNFLIRGTRFFAKLCARRSEKKRQAYDWEERLAYVGGEVEVEDDEISDDELDMQLERSCGVMRHIGTPKSCIKASVTYTINHQSPTAIMADAGNNNNHDNGAPVPSGPTGPPISPNIIARLRAAIADNPRQSTSVLVTALLTVCPALLTGPLLTLLGFGGLGPAAGLAAGFQSLFGTPWIFRVLQSAAMGGWGSALIQGLVRAFSAGGLVLEVVQKILGRDGEGSGNDGDEGSEE